MRIRKHVARNLSLSIPAQSCAAAAGTDREMGLHVCELNQSPWDAMAFTPPGGVSLYQYQVLEEVEEHNVFAWGATGRGQTDEEAATVSDVSGITTTESTLRRQDQVKTEVVMADAAEGDGEKRERKKDAKKRSTNGRPKKTKREHASFCATGGEDDEKVKMEVGSSSTASVAATCKKSDGKRWHCKRKAHHPHSLCDYHLSQVRSYYSNGVRTTHVLQQQQPLSKQNSALITDKMSTKKKKATTKKGSSSSNGNKTSTSSGGTAGWTRRKLPSDFFYYYSGFGPSRGKRRSDGGGHREGAGPGACDVDATDGDDAGDGGGYDGASLPSFHDQGLDDLDDDGDEDDLDGEYEADDVVASRRRRRKPVKARSLKSLL